LFFHLSVISQPKKSPRKGEIEGTKMAEEKERKAGERHTERRKEEGESKKIKKKG
jgi:hypothetical protein